MNDPAYQDFIQSSSLFCSNEGMPVKNIFSSARSIDDITTNFNNQFYKSHNGEFINDFLKRKKIKSWGGQRPSANRVFRKS